MSQKQIKRLRRNIKDIYKEYPEENMSVRIKNAKRAVKSLGSDKKDRFYRMADMIAEVARKMEKDKNNLT